MKTVAKAMDILEILTSSYKKLSLTTISELTGINKSSTYKILQVLCEYGYAEKVNNGAYYRLGPSIVDSDTHITQRSDLYEIAHPYLQQLSDATGHTTNLMILVGNRGVYLDVITKSGAINNIGMSDYLHATALGKAILAYIPTNQLDSIIARHPLKRICANTICDPETLKSELLLTKKRGFAIDDEENHIGSRCVAAPLLTPDGDVAGAISVSGMATTVPVSELFENSAHVVDIAREISAQL